MCLQGHLLLAALCFASAINGRMIAISQDVPSSASAIVNNDFVALSIEPSSLLDFTGTYSNAQNFSQTMTIVAP